MTNYEVIRECKQAYEILNDLLDNCEYVDEEDTESVNGLKDRHKIINAMELLDDIYTKAWHKIKKENDKMLETNVVDRFGHKVIISDLIGYAYLCEVCDENNYCFECNKYVTEMESEYKKYVYEDFNTLEQARDELQKYVDEKDSLLNEINEELANDNENIPYCNELIDEVVGTLNKIIEHETKLCWWN